MDVFAPHIAMASGKAQTDVPGAFKVLCKWRTGRRPFGSAWLNRISLVSISQKDT